MMNMIFKYFLILFFIFSINASILKADRLELKDVTFANLAHFASGVVEEFRGLQEEFIPNIRNTEDKLSILRVSFRNIKSTSGLGPNSINSLEQQVDDSDVQPAVIGKALCYPNPFKQSSDTGAWLGYELSKNLDVASCLRSWK